MHTVCETETFVKAGILVNSNGGVKKPIFLMHNLRNILQKGAFIPHPPTPCFVVELNYFAIILIVWSNTSTETICKETCV